MDMGHLAIHLLTFLELKFCASTSRGTQDAIAIIEESELTHKKKKHIKDVEIMDQQIERNECMINFNGWFNFPTTSTNMYHMCLI